MKRKIEIEIEVPDEATHHGDTHANSLYSEDVSWYKFKVNSTGVIRAWYRYNQYDKRWYYISEHRPHWIKAAPWHTETEEEKQK